MKGVEIVNSQDPLAGVAVARNSVIQVGITRYIGTTVEPSLVTYGRSPEYPNDDGFFEDFYYLRCTVAADKQSVTIDTLYRDRIQSTDRAKLFSTSSARIVNGQLVMEVTYQTAPVGEKRFILRFPGTGNGMGTITLGDATPGQALFSTQRPSAN